VASIGFTVTVAADTATPAVRSLVNGLQPAQLQPIIGRSARNIYREYLFDQNAKRANALGGKRTNFYSKAARGTSFDAVGDHVIISIASVGIAQRYFGGTIRAGANGSGKKFLTLPARAETHGKRASEFKDLEILWGRKGPYALAKRAATLISVGRPGVGGVRKIGTRGQQGGEVMFWLKAEITQQPDPTVLPKPENVGAAVIKDLGDYAQLLTDRAGGSTGGPN
jgi:hypothetical protein